MSRVTSANRPVVAAKTRARSGSAPGICVLVAYLCVSFFLTHANLTGTVLDHHNFPSQLQVLDKVYHVVSYGVLIFLVLFAFTKPVAGRSERDRTVSATHLIIWCVFVVIYGIFDEATQPYFGRRFEVLDLIANVFGIATGQMLFVVAEATGWRDRLLKML